MSAPSNVTAVVPLLIVTSMELSLGFYTSGLGFSIQRRWEPDGQLRWCRMSLGDAALMLQEATEPSREKTMTRGASGNGSSLYFSCNDALAIYRDAARGGVQAIREPQVGNFAWEVFFLDPDGYKINFSSPTDLPEETLLSEVEPAR
jgi:lactoylglutathione lyase